MLTLSKEKNPNNNNIWHSPSSKSNGIYTVEPVTHTTEHDAGSLSSSPLSSPDSKNMQSEPQQQPDATETNFNTSSGQSSPLSELTNLNDDDQPQDQQQQSSTGSSDSSSSNLNLNLPSGLVLNQNGITDGSRHAESKSDLSAEQRAGNEPAGESTNATATVNVTSQTQQPHQQQQRHTNPNTSNSSSPSPSHQHHVNGMGVAVRDSSSSTPAPTALISSTSSTFSHNAQSSEQHTFRPSLDTPNEKVATIFLLNVELFKVCMECQTRQLMQSSEFNAYLSRLQSNLSWLAAVADQNRLKHIPLPILTPPVPLPWHSPHTINDFYQRLSVLFARDIAKRQAAAALAANPGPGGGGMPPGSASVTAPRSVGASVNSVSSPHPSVPSLGPTSGTGVPIQPAPQNMMAAGIKRGPPTDTMHDDQTGMRKRVDTGERRHSNPPLAAAPTPPHVRSPSVMSNGTGVSVAGSGVGGMGMSNTMGMQDMNMHHQAQQMQTNNIALGMNVPLGGGMSGMPTGQTHSPHPSGPVAGHASHSPTPMRGPRSSPEVVIAQQTQAGMHSPQGGQSHGHLPQSRNPALLHHASNPQLGLGSQNVGMSMSDVQAQAQAAQIAQRARMAQQAQATAAMQSNRANANAMMHSGVASSAGGMKDPRMAAMMSNAGVGGPAIAPNLAMSMGQAQSTSQMAPTIATTASMNATGGMSMQIQPPPPPSATMAQAIVNAFGVGGLSNYQALQSGASHPFVTYMLTHVPGFAHLPWQQQLQRMQVVQNNIRQQQQQQRLQPGANNMPAGQGDQTNSRNGLINPAMQASAHPSQGHTQNHMDQAVASPFNRQSGSPPNVGGMSGLPSPQGQPIVSGQPHQHMSPPPGVSMPTRPGTAGSQSGSGAGPMNMGGQTGAHPVSVGTGGAGANQNITPQERQLRLMQQQMHHRGNDGVLNTVQALTSADKIRQHQQHQGGAGTGHGPQGQQIGMHPGAVSGQSSSAGSPPNTSSGASAPFGQMGGATMGIPMNMNMNMGNNMGMGGMGINAMSGMPNPNRSAPSPSDMLSAAAAARGAGMGGGVIAPNMAQKRPISSATAMQNDPYHQMALYNQAQQRQQQQNHQMQMAAGAIRPGTAMGGMNPAVMAAAAQQQQQQQHQQHQHQYANTAASTGGGTINPGMIYGGNNMSGAGNSSGGMQSSQSQQQAYLSQAQSAAQMSRSQSQPPFHAISPAALQHHPDGTNRIGTPGSVGGGLGGTPRPGSSASNAGSMLPTDGLGGDSLESLFNWNGA